LSRHGTALGVGEENLPFMRAACMGMANGMVVWGEQLVSFYTSLEAARWMDATCVQTGPYLSMAVFRSAELGGADFA
jgi:hypothetical protein